ncbi:hypothetical protein Angca_000049, partial [Angiostrongylus cantonensis]
LDFLIDASTLYGAADREILHIGDKALEIYQKAHPNFTVHDFFMKAGLDCEDIMMMCSFGGRRFDCCQYAHAILTNLGKCYTLNIKSSEKEWMKRQMETGVTAGLMALMYVLLPSERWGNCTSSWPPEFHSALPYSAVNCESICKANFFFSKCGCSPFTYDIENDFAMCSPFQTVRCIDDYIRKPTEGAESFEIPKCKSCQVECESVIYHTYNSYGYGFSNGALSWLSDIGGNMGMFLGMSMITLVEVIMFFTKIVWITISKKRRDYMYRKKMLEKEHEKRLEETMNNLTSLQHKK